MRRCRGDAVRRRCIWRNGRRPPARRRAKWCMRAFRAIGTWDAFARTGRWCSYLKSIIPSSLSAKMSWSMGIPRWFWRDWSDLTGPNRIIRKQRSLFWEGVCSETEVERECLGWCTESLEFSTSCSIIRVRRVRLFTTTLQSENVCLSTNNPLFVYRFT